MTGQIVDTDCVGVIGSRLTDRLLADRHTVVGRDALEDDCPRAIKEANLEGTRTNPASTLREVNIADIVAAAIGARGRIESSGLSGSPRAGRTAR